MENHRGWGDGAGKKRGNPRHTKDGRNGGLEGGRVKEMPWKAIAAGIWGGKLWSLVNDHEP